MIRVGKDEHSYSLFSWLNSHETGGFERIVQNLTFSIHHSIRLSSVDRQGPGQQCYIDTFMIEPCLENRS